MHTVVQTSLLSISRTFHLQQQLRTCGVALRSPRPSLAAAVLFSVSVNVHLPHTSGIPQHFSFYVWLISLSGMFSGFIQVVACVRMPSLCVAECGCTVRVRHVLCLHSCSDGHLGCFHPSFLVLLLGTECHVSV